MNASERTVPRVAESLDDLRVGQVVAWEHVKDDWRLDKIKAVSDHNTFTTSHGRVVNLVGLTLVGRPVVVLSDAADLHVSRAAIGALAEAYRHWMCDEDGPEPMANAISDVLDEVRRADS